MTGDFVENLKGTLVNTLSPIKAVRQEAEDALTNYLGVPNAFTGFLELACLKGDNSIDHLRMAAALALKNHVRHFWSTGTGKPGTLNPAPRFPMSKEEKEQMKVAIIEVTLVELNVPIKKILVEITRGVAEFEWPVRWPDLIPTLVSNIAGPDSSRVHNSLHLLRRLAKRLEYKPAGVERQPLHLLMAKTFPTIQQLIENLKPVYDEEIAAPCCVHMALKTLFSCIMYKLPSEEACMNYQYWFQTLVFFLEKPIVQNARNPEPQQMEYREKWPYWNVKKWASKIMMLFIQRYGNPKHVAAENVPFAKHFREVTSVELLGPVMNTLSVKSQGGYLTPIVIKNCIAYLNSSLEMAPTYKHIKPHMDFVLFQVIYPNLFLAPEEEELLEEDPVEFMRNVHSSSMEYIDVRTCTISLLECMVKYRENDCLPSLLAFVQCRLDEYAAATGPAKAALHGHKDAALITIGAVANSLIKSQKYKPTIEPFLANHIVPDMQSPSILVRYRCLWVIEWFVQLQWSSLAPSTLQGLMDGILRNFKHPSLAVQTGAAGALRSIIGKIPSSPSLWCACPPCPCLACLHPALAPSSMNFKISAVSEF